MSPDDPAAPLSNKRLILCSRENAARVAARIFEAKQSACVIRTGEPVQPYRAVETASALETVEIVYCV